MQLSVVLKDILQKPSHKSPMKHNFNDLPSAYEPQTPIFGHNAQIQPKYTQSEDMEKTELCTVLPLEVNFCRGKEVLIYPNDIGAPKYLKAGACQVPSKQTSATGASRPQAQALQSSNNHQAAQHYDYVNSFYI